MRLFYLRFFFFLDALLFFFFLVGNGLLLGIVAFWLASFSGALTFLLDLLLRELTLLLDAFFEAAANIAKSTGDVLGLSCLKQFHDEI